MLADGLLVLTLTVFAVATQIMLSAPLMVEFELGEPPPTPVIVIWATAFNVPLLWRRRIPCTVLLITAVHLPFVWASELGDIASQLTLGVAVYSAAVYGRPRRAAWCFGLCWAGLSVWLVVRVWGMVVPAQTIIYVPLTTAPFLLGWGLGRMTRLTRTLREYRAMLEERNAELTVEREANARLAVAEERLRFARDFHDVLGRNLTLIAVTSDLAAGLARRGDPDAVDKMLDVRSLAHESAREVREVVTGYRAADLDTELAGARSVLRAAGITTRVIGDSTCVPGDAQTALAWVLREATTNVIRHSNATTCTIEIGIHPGTEAGAADTATLRIHNDGAPPPDPLHPPGHGLAGLRERVKASGGHLAAGPEPGGFFTVEARLPTTTAAALDPAP
jgi:signal transduction histidine kinase